MQGKQTDFYLIGLMSVVAILSGYQLFFADDSVDRGDSGPRIAKISRLSNTVKTKSGNRVAWKDASQEEALFGGDQVYTHDQSQVEIKFEDNTEVSLLENSLFKINQEDEKPTLDLKKGLVYIKFSEKKSKLNLKIGDRKIEIKSKEGELQIAKDSKQTKITLLKGGVELNEKSDSVKLKKNQQLRIKKEEKINELEVLNVTLLEPTPQKIIFTTGEGPIEFEWFKTDKVTNTVFQLARDRRFSEIVHQREYRGDSIKLEKLEFGRYYWRVLYKAEELKEEGQSEIRSLTLKEDTPPSVLGPSDQSIVFIDPLKEENNINLQWVKEGSRKFQVELNLNGKRSLHNSSKPHLLFKNVKPGDMRLRVKTHPDERENSPWSNPINIKIKELILPKRVVMTSPQMGEKVTLPDNGVVEFTWEKDLNAKGHVFYLSGQKDFKQQTIKKIVGDNNYRWKGEGRGTFYWKVQAIDGLGREVKDDQFYQFELFDPPVEVVGPLAFSMVPMKRPDSPLEFRWRGRSTGRYILQVSANKNFDQYLLNKEVVGPQFSWKNGYPGKYYWRVKEILSTQNSQFTEPQSFEVKKVDPPKAPVFKNIPSLFQIEVEVKEENNDFSWLDIFISPVMAQKFNSSVTINWDQQEEAKEYLIEIYNNPNMETPLVQERVRNPSFKWKDPTQGTIYWRVAIIDYWGQVGDFSNLYESKLVLPSEYRPMKDPYLIYPKHGSTLAYEDEKENLEFRWGGDPKAQEYIFKVSSSLDFSNPIYEENTNTNELSVRSALLKGKGRLYWRVIAKDKLGRKKESRRRRIEFLKPNPVLAAKKVEEKKEKEIKIVKRKQYFKKVEKERTDYLRVVQSPTTIDYKMEQGLLNVSFDGLVLSSTEIEYFNKLKKKDFLLFNLKRTTGTAITTFSYSDTSLEGVWSRYTHWGQEFPLYYSAGIYANQGTIFKRKSVDEVEAGTTTSFGLKGALGGHKDFFWGTKQQFKIFAVAGTIISFGGQWDIVYKWSKNLFFSAGAEYGQKSFSGDEEAEVSVTEMKGRLGVGYYFF